MITSVLRHLVTERVSELKTDFNAEFFKNLWKSVTDQQRDLNGKNVNAGCTNVISQEEVYYCRDLQNKWGSYPILIHNSLSEFDSHPEGQW